MGSFGRSSRDPAHCRFARRSMLIALMGALCAPMSSARSQALDFRTPDAAPPAWGQFAKLVKYRFEEWIAADDVIANRFRAWVKAANAADKATPSSLVVKAWLNPDGTVERVTFPALNDERANSDLRLVLTRGNIGEPPPLEMIQPINLRFSLRLAKD